MSQASAFGQAPEPAFGDALAGLGNAKLAKIVAMVDALPARGDADALIAPLRPRLADMQVVRPVRFPRLLFMPLGAVLVHAKDWRRGSPSVPRVVLQPFANLVAAELQSEVAEIAGRLSLRSEDDRAMLLTEGHVLWPRAAVIMQAAVLPDSWTATGIAVGDFAPLTEAIGLVLEQSAWVLEPANAAAPPPDPGELALRLAGLLRSGARASASAVSCLLAAMLGARSGASAQIDAIEAKLEPSLRPLLRRCRNAALAFLMDRLEAGGSLAGSLWRAARQVQRDARMLADMTQEARHDPALRDRLQTMRRIMDERCRARFDAAVASELVSQAPATGRVAALSDDVMGALEEKARSLWVFAQSAGRIGSRPHYERGLGDVAERVARAENAGLGRMDRARLIESLQGSAAARARLTQLR